MIGAIAVWTNGAGGAGHVAYVTNVLNNGATVVVDEANYARFHAVSYGRRVPANRFPGYIYGGPAGNGPGTGGGSDPVVEPGPAVAEPPTNGNGFVYFVDNTGTLRVGGLDRERVAARQLWDRRRGRQSPSADMDANGDGFVDFVDSSGQLRLDHWTGSAWQDDHFGIGVASGTSPSAYLGRPNSDGFVYFVGSDGNLHVDHWTGS